VPLIEVPALFLDRSGNGKLRAKTGNPLLAVITTSEVSSRQQS
jgi:hypothetical protein